VYQPVEDSVSEGRFIDDVVPCIDGQLAGDDCRSCAVAIFDDLHQIAALAGIQSVWPPVVEDEQIGFDEAAEDFGEPPVAVRQFQLSEEPGQTMIKNRLAFPAGPLAERACEPRFADTARAGNHQVAVFNNPAPCGELLEECFVEFARCPVINILDSGPDMAQPS